MPKKREDLEEMKRLAHAVYTMDPAIQPEVEAALIDAMFKTEVPPEFIYAYSKVHVLIGNGNEDVVDPRDLAAWNAAVDEFRDLEPAEQAMTLQALRTREVQ